jgi:serine/threonine protein kinase
MAESTIDELERTATTAAEWLPGYELLGRLGAGAFGTVFKALQLKLERVVAVKVISIDDDTHPNIAARFETEALAHGKLHHANIVQVYDRGRHGERLFIAMELLEGEDLGNRLKRGGPMPERVAWAIARQTASALAHAHQQGVVHRDIKPANLFLVPAPSGLGLARDVPLVKVTDFGLALTKQAATQTGPRLTADGIVLGTPIYMAPEQYRHSPDLDHRADIYSLGATVAHMLNGHPPFDGPTVWEVMVQKLERGPQLDASLSAESRELIAAMMAPNAADRPATYETLIARIDALTAMQPGIAPQPAPAKRWPNWPILTIMMAALLGVAVAPRLFPLTRQTERNIEPPTALLTNGDHTSLFDGETLTDWLASGGVWQIGADEEGDVVLTGSGFIRRRFAALDDYRVTLGLDIHEAAAAEVHFAIPAPAPESRERFVLRITKAGGAILGTRRGDKGIFTPRGEAIPYPPATWFEGRKRYLEVRLQRAGGSWSAWFNGQLVGSASDDGGDTSPEIRLFADGGRARINTVELTRLQRP